MSFLHSIRFGFVIILMAFSLSACSGDGNDDIILEGERISVLAFEEDLIPDETIDISDLNILSALNNLYWPGPNGYSTNLMQNIAFDGRLENIWSVSIGEGANDDIPYISKPIIANEFVYTLDSEGALSKAHIETGEIEWQVRVNPRHERQGVIGGGVSYSNHRLFVSAGFDEVLAIDADNGGLIWRYKTRSPVRAAPTVLGSRVFVATADSETLALDRDQGILLWRHAGLVENVRIMGASGPAVSKHLVVVPYASGEIYALRTENGADLWSQHLTSRRTAFQSALSRLGDVQAAPVIEGGIIYAMNFAGTLTAIKARSGARIWQQNIGGTQTPWVSGDFIFVLSDENILYALKKRTGDIVWLKQLQRYEEPETYDDPILYQGPIMAGSKLYLVSSYGEIIQVDPYTGEILKTTNVYEPILSAPVVASKTLFVLTQEGNLLAFK